MKRKLLLIVAGAILGIIVLNFSARGAEPAKTQSNPGGWMRILCRYTWGFNL